MDSQQCPLKIPPCDEKASPGFADVSMVGVVTFLVQRRSSIFNCLIPFFEFLVRDDPCYFDRMTSWIVRCALPCDRRLLPRSLMMLMVYSIDRCSLTSVPFSLVLSGDGRHKNKKTEISQICYEWYSSTTASGPVPPEL